MKEKVYPRHIIRLSVAAFFFIYGFTFASWASRIPHIQQQLKLSETQLGMVLFALPVGSFLSLPLSGWLVAKKGSRLILMIAALCYIITLVFIGNVSNVYQLLIVLFAFGMAGNMGNISVNTQAVGVESYYEKPIMGTFHGIWSLAGFSGAAVGTFMIAHTIEPKYHFILVSIFCFLTGLSAYTFLIKRDKVPEGAHPMFALPDRSLVVLGTIALCSMICEGAMFDWSGIYFTKVVKAPVALVGAGYTAFMCTMAFSRFFSDHITSRIGFKKTIQLSGIIIMSGLLIAVAFPFFYPSILGFLLVGAGVSSIIPQVYSSAGKSKKLSPGIALASVSSIGFLGFLLGPPLIGILAGISSLRLSFTIIAFMGILVTILISITKEKY